jgi:putative endonuclease
MFFVYVLRSLASGLFYVGHTEDLRQRIREHCEGCSHYTRSRGPWQLVFVETFLSRSDAMARERQIKSRKSKKYIERLIESDDGKWRERISVDGEVG